MAYFENIDLGLSGAPQLWNISSSLDPGCPTLLLNTATMQPVAHWVELDRSSDSDGIPNIERALLLWPSERLNDSTTYIVAYRNVVDDNGVPIAPSDGFAAIKYNVTTNNPALEGSRARFARIFGVLASYGWDVRDVTLTWDFTTNTGADVMGRFVSMRDDALARGAAGGINNYTIDIITDNPNPSVRRMVQGA
jgi:hypothetical protein